MQQKLRFSSEIEILEPLHSGGMGELFTGRKVFETGVFKDVVIKRISKKHLGDSDARNQFVLEARLHAQLCHPHIVQLFDFFEQEGAFYMILEHVKGCDLSGFGELISKENVLRRSQLALEVLLEQLSALSLAHQHLIHRDLSPSNILVSCEGHTKLCDFGLAVQEPRRRLHSNEANGTFQYMSPEQSCGYPIDRRSDLFSLAACAFELVTQKPLHQGTPAEIVKSLRTGSYFRELKIRDLPAPVSDLFKRAMQPSIHERFQTAEEFRSACLNLRREMGIECRAVGLEDVMKKRKSETTGQNFLRPETFATPDAAKRGFVWLAFILSMPGSLLAAGLLWPLIGLKRRLFPQKRTREVSF